MGRLDEFFHDPPLDHPRLRAWRSMRARSGAVLVRAGLDPERDGLSFAPALLHLQFLAGDGRVLQEDFEPWDFQLALSVIQEGWRAPALQNEAERVGLLLKHLLAPANVRFGDGCFNSILYEVVRAGGLGQHPAVAAVLSEIREPATGARSWKLADQCKDLIVTGIARAVVLLADSLQYPEEQAAEVLCRALAYYLDERFSVTPARLLGLHRSA